MPVDKNDTIVDVTKSRKYLVAITFKYSGGLYTLVGDPDGEDFFIDHATGKHLKLGSGRLYDDLTDYFNQHELWDV